MGNITKEMFDAFNKVRENGKYNMIMNAKEAAEDAGLSMDDYWIIIKNYTELNKKFGG
jgi:hypothetical protein